MGNKLCTWLLDNGKISKIRNGITFDHGAQSGPFKAQNHHNNMNFPEMISSNVAYKHITTGSIIFIAQISFQGHVKSQIEHWQPYQIMIKTSQFTSKISKDISHFNVLEDQKNHMIWNCNHSLTCK